MQSGLGVGRQDEGGKAPVARRLHGDLATEQSHLGRELAVVRLVGDALGDEPGEDDADRPEQEQRRQHPVEDLAEERMLSTPGHAHGYAAALSRQ